MADFQPQSISIPPGVVSVPTRASKSANWAESNLMRWVGGKLSPIGGWAKLNIGSFASPVRYIHRWTTNNGLQITAYLCRQHLYVDLGDGIQDISPTPAIEPPSDTVAGGYGDYMFNYGNYNTPRPDRDSLTVLPPVYKLDNWGENLVAMTSNDGRLLMWDPNTPTTAADVVAGAPLNNRTFLVTPQRHVILFGVGGDANRYQWCDEEDITDWTLGSTTTKGGDFSIQPSSAIITAEMSGADIVMFTANNNGFVISYLGLPFIYGCEQFQSDAVPQSPKSLINTPQGAVWASKDGFWYFSGNSAASLTCAVWSWIDEHIDRELARNLADFVIIPAFSELYYFFPSKGSTANDRYVVWNYKDNWWGTGKMKRSCGVKSTYVGYPLLSDGTSVYQHESGSAYTLQEGEELPWARTYNINLAGGAILASIGNMLPDVGGDISSMTFVLDYTIPRSGQNIHMTSGDKSVIGGYVGFRDTGRDFQLTVKQKVNVVASWTMGDALLDVIPRGRL